MTGEAVEGVVGEGVGATVGDGVDPRGDIAHRVVGILVVVLVSAAGGERAGRGKGADRGRTASKRAGALVPRKAIAEGRLADAAPDGVGVGLPVEHAGGGIIEQREAAGAGIAHFAEEPGGVVDVFDRVAAGIGGDVGTAEAVVALITGEGALAGRDISFGQRLDGAGESGRSPKAVIGVRLGIVVRRGLASGVDGGDSVELAEPGVGRPGMRGGVVIPRGGAFGFGALGQAAEQVVGERGGLVLGVGLRDEFAGGVVDVVPRAHVGIEHLELAAAGVVLELGGNPRGGVLADAGEAELAVGVVQVSGLAAVERTGGRWCGIGRAGGDPVLERGNNPALGVLGGFRNEVAAGAGVAAAATLADGARGEPGVLEDGAVVGTGTELSASDIGRRHRQSSAG